MGPAVRSGFEPGCAKNAWRISLKTKHADHVGQGFRVLSVDLGVRTFATCSVFELKGAGSGGAFQFPAEGSDLVAVHERSFTLTLPGDNPGGTEEVWRESHSDELRQQRQALGRYRRLRSLVELEPDIRAESLKEIAEAAAKNGWPLELLIIDKLRDALGSPEPVWSGEIEKSLSTFRQDFGGIVKEWRRRTRTRSDERYSGKSIWAIEHLTNVRRFLQGWSLLSERGEIRRLDLERHGVFAKRLLDHIGGLKDDRLKTGADMLVQAARGYRRDGRGQWKKAYDPCEVILFEDLSRYRMRTDRPRRENSLLMRWAHRAMPAEVGMQAELYGIHIAETGAAFSSRYHARASGM